MKPHELDNAPMVLYPPSSNMRTIIDRFFTEIGVTPRVIMEAADTEVIKCMVETGFGYSVLPKYALVNSKGFFQTFRICGHRLFRQQAMAIFHATHERPLTTAIVEFLKEQMDQIEAPRGMQGGFTDSQKPRTTSRQYPSVEIKA
jgi:LysR family cys regulon transcriptional activator